MSKKHNPFPPQPASDFVKIKRFDVYDQARKRFRAFVHQLQQYIASLKPTGKSLDFGPDYVNIEPLEQKSPWYTVDGHSHTTANAPDTSQAFVFEEEQLLHDPEGRVTLHLRCVTDDGIDLKPNPETPCRSYDLEIPLDMEMWSDKAQEAVLKIGLPDDGTLWTEVILHVWAYEIPHLKVNLQGEDSKTGALIGKPQYMTIFSGTGIQTLGFSVDPVALLIRQPMSKFDTLAVRVEPLGDTGTLFLRYVDCKGLMSPPV